MRETPAGQVRVLEPANHASHCPKNAITGHWGLGIAFDASISARVLNTFVYYCVTLWMNSYTHLILRLFWFRPVGDLSNVGG